MKTLYASDLDGTLLDERSSLSPGHAALLARLCARGLLFAAATARSPMSAALALKSAGIKTTAPSICMNGALIWDFEANEPVKAFPVPKAAEAGIREIYGAFPLSPRVMLAPENGVFTSVYRPGGEMPGDVFAFMNTLVSEKTPLLPLCALPEGGRVLALSFQDEGEKLLPVRDRLEAVPGLEIVFYKSTSVPGRYFLEAHSKDAGKGAGVEYVKALTGADRAVVFGDNFNDLSMFAAADESFAPENAEEEVKKLASGVTLSNAEGGVVLKIAELFESAVRA